jgi:hypothetical protein
VGRAVGDVIHLLAELIENATAFSPPHTRVQVTGQSVPNGFVVEIEDRGLGMTADAIDEANRRLAEPPEFDPANSARLGLFVVAQLAVRHRVRVMLRPSPYGGVTAVALLPMDLVAAATPALPAGVAPELRNTHELPMVEAPAPARVRGRAALSAVPDEPKPSVQPEMSDVTDIDRPGTWFGPHREARPDAPAAVAPRPEASGTAVPQPRSRPHSEPLGDPPGTTRGGLPKRVRQQSLAPQLQHDDRTVVLAAEDVAVPATTRSPEQLRRMMSSFQAGTVRGRHASLGGGAADDGGSGDSGADTDTDGDER